MEVKKIQGDDLQSAAMLLRNYWKERGMSYAQERVLNYITKGHQTEIKKDQFFVIKENEKVIGTCSLIINCNDVAEIRDFVIKKDQRKKGYGMKAFKYLLEQAKQNSVRKIVAYIFQKNRSFYESQGFALEGFLKDHFKEGEHMLVMSKYLKEKEARQVDLRKKLEDEQEIQSIAQETSDRLMKLKLRK